MVVNHRSPRRTHALPRKKGARIVKKNLKAESKQRKKLCRGPALLCDGLEEFLTPKCNSHRAMIVPRSASWADFQTHIDKVAKSATFGELGEVHKDVKVTSNRNKFLADLKKKAKHLVELLKRNGFPNDICGQVQQDFENIGTTLLNLDPSTKSMELKLCVVGADSCCRWHRDYYTGRAIVSYNTCGTKFVDHKHVNFWEMENCGKNSCMLRKGYQIYKANVADILFMKGMDYPNQIHGLVHSAPSKRRHSDGSIKNRLIIKVDLP